MAASKFSFTQHHVEKQQIGDGNTMNNTDHTERPTNQTRILVYVATDKELVSLQAHTKKNGFNWNSVCIPGTNEPGFTFTIGGNW